MCNTGSFIVCIYWLPGNVQNNGKINIVCTTYPQYNWIQNIIGEESEEFNLTLLVDGGADLHSYQPSAKDMAKISSADMFVYVGGSSDAWVFDAVRETVNKNMKKSKYDGASW